MVGTLCYLPSNRLSVLYICNCHEFHETFSFIKALMFLLQINDVTEFSFFVKLAAVFFHERL